MPNIIVSVAVPSKNWYWVTGTDPLLIDGVPYSAGGEIAGVNMDDKIEVSVNILDDGLREEIQSNVGQERIEIKFWLNGLEVLPGYYGTLGISGIRDDVWTVEVDDSSGQEPERVHWSHEYQQQRFPEGDLFFQNLESLSEKELGWPNSTSGGAEPTDITRTYNPIAYEPPPPSGPIPHIPIVPVDPPTGPTPIRRTQPRVVGGGIEDQIGSARLDLRRYFTNSLSFTAASVSRDLDIDVTRTTLTVGFTGNTDAEATVVVVGYEHADRTGNAVSTSFEIRRALVSNVVPVQTVFVARSITLDLDNYFRNAGSYQISRVAVRGGDTVRFSGERFLRIIGEGDNGIVPARLIVRAYDRTGFQGNYVQQNIDTQVVTSTSQFPPTLEPSVPVGPPAFDVAINAFTRHAASFIGDPQVRVNRMNITFSAESLHSVDFRGVPFIGTHVTAAIPTQVIPVGETVRIDLANHFANAETYDVDEPYEIYTFQGISIDPLNVSGLYDAYAVTMDGSVVSITANDPNPRPTVIRVTATDRDGNTVSTYFGVRVMNVGGSVYFGEGAMRVSGIRDIHSTKVIIPLDVFFSGANNYRFTTDNEAVLLSLDASNNLTVERNPVRSEGGSLITIEASDGTGPDATTVTSSFRMTWPVANFPVFNFTYPTI